ncbi:MAG TPA: glycosyltransferase [Oscillatoriales cyanobacterium M59_W2019_021]|nr:glycosyltransferase [Oscillatoriales cyanobacterium M4454_W2019_049]HIK52355.1 glycosyltransferase [Oscillatoriales cyanobacterium M59_W2019_021]
MTEWQLKTPVAFLIFNRPDVTERVFETIRQAKPPKLLVVADGPRADRPGEAQKCAATRAIVDRIDWDCQVFKNYSDTNLGCRHRVASGLTWVFETVEEAIILEDDCLPHPSFFRFCEELLDRYRDDNRVMAISGDNFQFGNRTLTTSYYFSRYMHVWGWATWRRAWQFYDLDMKAWSHVRETNWLTQKLQSDRAAQFWSSLFQNAYSGFNTWDYAWVFACWMRDGLVILPNVNLISNLGFGAEATHTKEVNIFSNMKAEEMIFPLVHPTSIVRDIKADWFTEKNLYSGDNEKVSISISNPSKSEDDRQMEDKGIEVCKVCGSLSRPFDRATLLQKYEVNYFQCSQCGFVQTEEPYWLEEAYSSAIASSDVGLVARNLMFSQITSRLIFSCFHRQGKFLDYGGGYGLFVRLMRDLGLDFYWHDRYASNLFSQGFEVEDSDDRRFELVTAFELFEHFANPQQEVERLLKFSKNILFSTELLPNTNPKPHEWWYYATHEGQHISLYTPKALSILARKFNLNLYSNGQNLHLLTEKTIDPNLFQRSVQYQPPQSVLPSRIPQDYQAAIARIERQKTTLNIGTKKIEMKSQDRVKILIDAVFFQLYQTGIARLWRSLLEEWSTGDFAKQILVLDRAGTAPRIPGIKYLCLPRYDYNNTEADRQTLQKICDEEAINIFVSSYYTTPVTTRSVFMAYDMIPEIAGYNPENPMWREKKYGLEHASSYIAISENTAQDLVRLFPQIDRDSITVSHCGVSSVFSAASSTEIESFKQKYGISKPYFMLVGMRVGYKNAILFFKALNELENKHEFEIVCTGGGPQLEPEFQPYISGIKAHMVQLSDEDLRTAYSGAVALAFPSQYEGFGLPVLEAMACGCPVITCRKSSLPEVGGNAVIYVDEQDVAGMANALREVQKAEVRNALITAGLDRAKQFSWSKMANRVSEALIKAAGCSTSSVSSSPVFSDGLLTQIQAYQQNSLDRNSLPILQQARKKLAQYWLNLPADRLESEYQSELGKLHLAFWNSGFKNELRTEEEKLIATQISAKVAKGFNELDAIQALIAATLYFYPHQLSIQYQRAPIPNWFAASYLQFMFESPRLFQELGEVDRYADYFHGWIDYLHGNITSNPDFEVWKYVSSVFANQANLTPLYFSGSDLKQEQSQRSQILELYLKQNGCQLDYTFPERSTTRSKIRLGILCQNFYPSAETFTVLPVFEHLDRDRFEVYLYALDVGNTSSEQLVRDRSDKFVHLSDKNLDSLVQTLRADDLDIILIGSNITARSYPLTLLSMHRLARIQTVSLADPVTTGMRNIDYYIAGNLTVSDTAQQSYQEKLVTIDGSGLCFRFPPDPAPTLNPTRQSWGANEGTTIFISGSNFRKINPEVRHTWAKILAAVPNSILALYPFGPNWGRHPQLELPFYQNLQAVFAQYGIAPNRLVLIKTLPNTADIRKCLEIADIYLDSYPYSGAASALDPLKVHLPIVTMEGRELRHRQSAALLKELQIPDLIARSESEYIQLAVSLGTNPQLRQQKRMDIQQKMRQTPQFLDSRSYSEKMGALFQKLFREWQSPGSKLTIKSNVSQFPTQIGRIEEDRSPLTPQLLDRLSGCLNLYQIDPSDRTTISELMPLRRKLAEHLLTITPHELENLYQSEVGKAYRALLKSGIQKQPNDNNDGLFVQQLTQQGVGLTNPQAVNALMGAMLYYAPGTLKVQNYRDRLPKWLIEDYEQVFESDISTSSSSQPQVANSPEISNLPQLSIEFLNRLLGCVNLYEIDPSEPSIISELHQLRRQLSEYWLKVPTDGLETLYKAEVGRRYQALLKSGFQKESIPETDRTFVQEITQIASSSAHPQSLNAMLAAMLYYTPSQLKIQNARDRLPGWLIEDYERVFEQL